MGLAELFAEEKKKGHSRRCYVCTLLTTLPPNDAKALTAALEDKHLSSTGITRVLVADGHKVYAHSVARHRRKECLQS